MRHKSLVVNKSRYRLLNIKIYAEGYWALSQDEMEEYDKLRVEHSLLPARQAIQEFSDKYLNGKLLKHTIEDIEEDIKFRNKLRKEIEKLDKIDIKKKKKTIAENKPKRPIGRPKKKAEPE